MDVPDDRRRYTRFGVPVTVALAWSGGDVVGVTDDLSAGGCRLPMAVPPPAGTLVKVRLEFEGADQALIGSARVAWAMPGQPGPPGAPGTLGACGLAFALPLIEATVPLLRRLVDAAPVEVDPAGG